MEPLPCSLWVPKLVESMQIRAASQQQPTRKRNQVLDMHRHMPASIVRSRRYVKRAQCLETRGACTHRLALARWLDIADTTSTWINRRKTVSQTKKTIKTPMSCSNRRTRPGRLAISLQSEASAPLCSSHRQQPNARATPISGLPRVIWQRATARPLETPTPRSRHMRDIRRFIDSKPLNADTRSNGKDGSFRRGIPKRRRPHCRRSIPR